MTIDSIKTYADLAEYLGGCVLCNNITEHELDLENGSLTDEYGNYVEVFQYYIIQEWAADFLKVCTDEIVFYNYDLDIYVWGITHFGTGWDYVPFEFPNNDDEKEEEE